jgi:xylulokinase
MAFDIHTRQWSQRLLNLAGIDAALLAETAPAGTAVGVIPDAKAAELGLKPGVVVTVAGHDAFNGAFGAGVIDAGRAALTVGTTESVVVALAEPKTAETLLADMLACYCHTYPGRYAILAYSTCSGNLLRWYRDTFGDQEIEEARLTGKDAYDILVAEANLGKSKLLLLPHFIGSGTPHLDPRSRGALLGLNLSTQPGDIIAAILEGTTFELLLNIRSVEKAGIEVSEMRAVGGGAKSDRWLQLKADITGKPITRLDLTECGALGSAIQAGVACGTYSSQGEALEQLVKPSRTFEPNPARSERYEEMFELYCHLYDSTKPYSEALSNY